MGCVIDHAAGGRRGRGAREVGPGGAGRAGDRPGHLQAAVVVVLVADRNAGRYSAACRLAVLQTVSLRVSRSILAAAEELTGARGGPAVAVASQSVAVRFVEDPRVFVIAAACRAGKNIRGAQS